MIFHAQNLESAQYECTFVKCGFCCFVVWADYGADLKALLSPVLLDRPPPPAYLWFFLWLMRVLIEGYRHDRQSSLSSQYSNLFISSASNKNCDLVFQ